METKTGLVKEEKKKQKKTKQNKTKDQEAVASWKPRIWERKTKEAGKLSKMITENQIFSHFPCYCLHPSPITLFLLASNSPQNTLKITTKFVFLENFSECISLMLRRSHHYPKTQFLCLVFQVTVNLNSMFLSNESSVSLQFKLSTLG